MKILHVLPSFGMGGMEKIACTLINSTFDHYIHEVLALDQETGANAWISSNSVQLNRLNKQSGSRQFLNALGRALHHIRPDVLMTYNWGATDAIWLGRLAGIRQIIHSEHGFSVEEEKKTLWTRDCVRFLVYRLASKVIVVSRELESILATRFWLSKDKVKRISNGVNTSHYSPNSEERRSVRSSLGFSDTECVIGFSGRLDPIKNLDLLLDVFRFSNPSDYPFRLLVVGDGPARLHLESRCGAEGLSPYVKFVGQQSEVLRYLRVMDVFMLTSLREQMPLTVLEAMAVGVPVIATRVGELPYIISDGIDGFVRDRNAPVEAFVQPLRSLLCISKRNTLGTAARQKVVEQFQLGSMIKEYAELLKQSKERRSAVN